MTTAEPGRCTWPKPSRNADVRCGEPAVAAWVVPGGGQQPVRRCRRHYRPEAEDAALSLHGVVLVSGRPA